MGKENVKVQTKSLRYNLNRLETDRRSAPLYKFMNYSCQRLTDLIVCDTLG